MEIEVAILTIGGADISRLMPLPVCRTIFFRRITSAADSPATSSLLPTHSISRNSSKAL